jgi:hypothetical protein
MRSADECDLDPGVMILINGQYPGHDGRFAPTAPQLATAIRMARDKRLEHERRERLNQPRLAPPDVVSTPEERARAKTKLDHFLQNVGDRMRTDDATITKSRNHVLAKTNARFAPDMSDDAVANRLLFSVGDPDGDRDVA